MEPVFMALGKACGIAAQQVEVRRLTIPDLQREILKRGGVILYEAQPISEFAR